MFALFEEAFSTIVAKSAIFATEVNFFGEILFATQCNKESTNPSNPTKIDFFTKLEFWAKLNCLAKSYSAVFSLLIAGVVDKYLKQHC